MHPETFYCYMLAQMEVPTAGAEAGMLLSKLISFWENENLSQPILWLFKLFIIK